MDIYGNFMTWPSRTSARTKNSCTKKSATTNLTPASLAFKIALLKPFWEFGFFGAGTTHLFGWPCNKPFLAPNFNVLVCLALLCRKHMNLCSLTLSHCSLFFFFWLCHTSCSILFPHPGINPCPLHWEPGVLTTEPSRKSLSSF